MDTALAGIVEVALEQGIWAALYIYLFFRMLRENAQREERYQHMIDDLSRNIQSGIHEIQNQLDGMLRETDHGMPKANEKEPHYIS